MFQLARNSDAWVTLSISAKTNYCQQADQYLIDSALESIRSVSRTCSGESNTDISPDKPKLSVEGKVLKERAAENIESTLNFLFSYPELELNSESETAQLFAVVALKINAGLTQPTRYWRTWETNITHQAAVVDIKPMYRNEFCRGFLERFNDRSFDPIKFAHWIEKYANTELHPLSDGCGRFTKVLAAWILGRSRIKSPIFKDNSEYFSVMLKNWAESLQAYKIKVAENN